MQGVEDVQRRLGVGALDAFPGPRERQHKYLQDQVSLVEIGFSGVAKLKLWGQSKRLVSLDGAFAVL